MRGFRRPQALLAGSVLLAVLAFVALRAAEWARAGRPDAVYTLIPRPGKGTLHVRLELSGLRPGPVLLAAPESGPAPAVGPTGGEGEPPSLRPEIWRTETDRRGRLRFEYEVAVAGLDSRHALLFGARVFAVPLRSDPRASLFTAGPPPRGAAARIALRFRLPAGWDAYAPWGELEGARAGAIELPDGRFARLRESVIALGDWVPRRFRTGRTEVLVAVRGADPLSEDALVGLFRDCLAAHAHALGSLPRARVLIAVDHPYRGEQAAGQAVLDAASLHLSRDPAALRSPSTLRVVAHELGHFWNGGAVDLADPAERWFAEGVTDYYALRGLAAAGRLSLAGLADELAAGFERLAGNPWADSSLAALGTGYPTDPQAWTATYAKGALAAWALDLRLAGAGGLDAVMRSLLGAGGPARSRRVLAAAAGGRAAGLLDSLSGPTFRVALERELAAKGLRLVRRPSGEMTLGLRFFRPGTTEVLDLDPDGPAARQGLRAGDRVIAVNRRAVRDLSAVVVALDDARGDAVLLTVDREGAQLEFELEAVPAYATQVNAVPAAPLATQAPGPGELRR